MKKPTPEDVSNALSIALRAYDTVVSATFVREAASTVVTQPGLEASTLDDAADKLDDAAVALYSYALAVATLDQEDDDGE